MSTFATHIVLAQKVIHHFPNINKAEYFIGTIYPDIRYLNVLSRELTHINPTIKEGDSAFIIGMKVHNIVDIARDDFVIKNGIYEIYRNIATISTSSKFYDDIVLYDKISNWEEISDYVRNISEEEKKFNVTLEILQKWHSLTLDYIKNPPNDQSVINVSTEIGAAPGKINEMNIAKNKILNDRPDYMERFYESFDIQ